MGVNRIGMSQKAWCNSDQLRVILIRDAGPVADTECAMMTTCS